MDQFESFFWPKVNWASKGSTSTFKDVKNPLRFRAVVDDIAMRKKACNCWHFKKCQTHHPSTEMKIVGSFVLEKQRSTQHCRVHRNGVSRQMNNFKDVWIHPTMDFTFLNPIQPWDISLYWTNWKPKKSFNFSEVMYGNGLTRSQDFLTINVGENFSNPSGNLSLGRIGPRNAAGGSNGESTIGWSIGEWSHNSEASRTGSEKNWRSIVVEGHAFEDDMVRSKMVVWN